MRCAKARAGLAVRQRPRPTRRQRDSSILEFAASLPLFLILLVAFGFAVWTFWAQTAVDVAAAEAQLAHPGEREAASRQVSAPRVPSGPVKKLLFGPSFMAGIGAAASAPQRMGWQVGDQLVEQVTGSRPRAGIDSAYGRIPRPGCLLQGGLGLCRQRCGGPAPLPGWLYHAGGSDAG